MPRARKTQPVADFPSPGYGQGEELAQMQSEIPLPNDRPAEVPMPRPEPTDPIAMAQQYVNPIGVTPGSPTANPSIPVTQGLPIGAGAGPEVLRKPQRRNVTADTLDLLAQISGDSTLASRAARVRGGI